MKLTSRDILALFILFLFCFIFHYNLFLNLNIYSVQDLGRGDITHLQYPLKDFYEREIREFRFPLWTDLVYKGYPVFAEGQMGALYLPNLVLFFIFPTYMAFNLSYLVTFFIAASGVYFLCRWHRLDSIAAMFGAVAFTFSMFFVGHVIHLNLLASISLAPWILYFAFRLLDQRKGAFFVLLSFLISQQIFAGFYQTVMYTLIGLVLFMVVWYLKQKNFAKNLAVLIMAVFLGIMMSAIQILPTWEAWRNSVRVSFGKSENLVYDFGFKDLAYFIYPYFYGDPSKASYRLNPEKGLFWENNVYFGILPLLLAIFALTKFKKLKEVRFYFIAFLIVILFSVGILPFLYSIPPISFFRLPHRALFLALMFLAILAAYGLQFLLDRFGKKREIAFYLGILVVLITFLELFYFGASYNGSFNHKKWLEAPPTAEFIKNQAKEGRIYSANELKNWYLVYENVAKGWRDWSGELLLSTRGMLNPNANILYQIPSIQGYPALALKSNNLIELLVNSGGPNVFKILGGENVKYIISPDPILSEDLEEVFAYTDEKAQVKYLIYENKEYLERVRGTNIVKSFANLNELVAEIQSPSFDPKNTAYLLGQVSEARFDEDPLIQVVSLGPRSLEIKTSSQDRAFVVVSDTYYPGWKATIDGVRSRILNVNINSRGIVVPAGEHIVRMRYDPASFKVGFIISILSLFAVLGFSKFYFRR